MTRDLGRSLSVFPRRPVRVLALALSLLGCGGGGGTIGIDGLSAQYLDAVCQRAARCGEFPDKATCVANNALDIGQTIADVKAGRITYNGSAAAQCIAAVNSATGFASCDRSEATALPQSCEDMLKGTLATGAACFIAGDCQSGLCDTSVCAADAVCCAGTCSAAPTPPPIGAACTPNVVPACVDGAFCMSDSTGAAGTCAMEVAMGQTCTGAGQCVSGTVCLPGTASGTEICSKLPAEGQSCATPGACDDEADYCDQTTRLCTHRLPPGAACPSGDECVFYATCDATTMTCVAIPAAGAACTVGVGCLGTYQCTAGTCTAAPTSAPCP